MVISLESIIVLFESVWIVHATKLAKKNWGVLATSSLEIGRTTSLECMCPREERPSEKAICHDSQGSSRKYETLLYKKVAKKRPIPLQVLVLSSILSKAPLSSI